MTFDNISLISHADLSKSPHKCWMAFAVLQANRRWLVCELFNVTQLSSLFSHLKSRLLQPGCILSGFDFPIGLPADYAEKAGITDLLAASFVLGKVEWDQF
jgi:hypothetical protein